MCRDIFKTHPADDAAQCVLDHFTPGGPHFAAHTVQQARNDSRVFPI